MEEELKAQKAEIIELKGGMESNREKTEEKFKESMEVRKVDVRDLKVNLECN
jgi:hypothetical protein